MKKIILGTLSVLLPFLILWCLVASLTQTVSFDVATPILKPIGDLIQNCPTIDIQWSFSEVLPHFSKTGVGFYDFFITLYEIGVESLDVLLYFVQSMINVSIFIFYFLRFLFTGVASSDSFVPSVPGFGGGGGGGRH